MQEIDVLMAIIALAALALCALLALTSNLDLKKARMQFDAERRQLLDEIGSLKEMHQKELEVARKDTADKQRAVFKGQAAEQMIPFSRDFIYLPADMHFVGYPIDYIVFNGLTDLRDNGGDESKLEVILLEIKQGQSWLGSYQKAIKSAVDQKRVSFVTMTVGEDISAGNIRTRS